MRAWQVVHLGGRMVRRGILCVVGLAAFIQLGPVATMAASLLLSLLVYAMAFGLHFAIGFVLLLLVHELGHVIASRAVGLTVTEPIFIPFLGAAIRLNQPPINARMEANIAIGGPAVGTLSSLVCLVGYFWDDSILMLVLAYTACLLNLFNLIPCDPLDGGKIAGAISPRMWWLGSIVIGMLFFYTKNLLILVILCFSIFRLWRGEEKTGDYYCLTIRQRLTMFWWYLGLVAVLGGTTVYIAEILR